MRREMEVEEEVWLVHEGHPSGGRSVISVINGSLIYVLLSKGRGALKQIPFILTMKNQRREERRIKGGIGDEGR